MSKSEEQILAESLERLLLSRRAHRAQLTKLLNSSSNISENLADADNLHALEGILDSMDTKLDVQILDLTALEKLETAIVESDDYTEKHKTLIRRQKRCYKEATADRKESNAKANGSSKKVHLPKLNLPKFDGDILEYISFREMFDAAIHSDAQLDKVEKFQYLKGVLTGEAAAVIAGLPLTSKNYDEAMDLIHKRYGQ